MIKGLSLKEPWASKVFSGEKTLETRTWVTKYRGLVLLCASRQPISDLSGKAFAVARITNCRPMTADDEVEACIEVYDRANVFVLEDVRPIEQFQVRGSLCLFKLEQEIIDKIRYL